MSEKVGANEPCPCGSGKKYKKCCGAVGATALAPGALYDEHDRAKAFRLLEGTLERATDGTLDVYAADDDDGDYPNVVGMALSEFFAQDEERVRALREDPDFAGPQELIYDAFDYWLFFDYVLPNGRTFVQLVLEDRGLNAGVRAYLEQLSASAPRLYEVTDSTSDSMTVRDKQSGDVVKTSLTPDPRKVPVGQTIVARLLPNGVRGTPTLEDPWLQYFPAYAPQEVEAPPSSIDEAKRQGLRLTQAWLRHRLKLHDLPRYA